MKKALLIGTYQDAQYHTLENVDKEMDKILEGVCELTFTDKTADLLDLEQYDMLISYIDLWKGEINDEEMASMVKYVAQGKPMLVIHNGISFQNRKEFVHLAGGAFDNHQAKRDLTVTMLEHEITKDLKTYVSFEEPYKYNFDPFAQITMLSEYSCEEDGKTNTYPHSWINKFCKGEVGSFLGGHTYKHFQEEGNAEFIKSMAKYLLRK